MVEILNYPLIVGIGSSVIAGLILYFIFGIGKDKKTENTKSDFSGWEIKGNKVSGQGASLVQINYPKNEKEENKSSDNNLEIQKIQKQKFEENRRNFLDPRNSNR